uniref:RNA silencing suppressor protein P0 n=1 Tax=Sugarcane yellow leaf virus TaxID=94290 RepID=A0A0N6W253_9VIRU|nr:RNA silencing suppressor protein P0 [Sugarcane yellow leaf virus]
MLFNEFSVQGIKFRAHASTSPVLREDVSRCLTYYRVFACRWIELTYSDEHTRHLVHNFYGPNTPVYFWLDHIRAVVATMVPILLLPDTTLGQHLHIKRQFLKSVLLWLARNKLYHRVTRCFSRRFTLEQEPISAELFRTQLLKYVGMDIFQDVARLQNILERGYDPFRSVLGVLLRERERFVDRVLEQPPLDPSQTLRLCFHYHDTLDHDDSDSDMETARHNRLLGLPIIRDLPDDEKALFIHSNLVGASTFASDV